MSEPIDPSLEVWKQIQNYEGLYSVSNFGRVRREISVRCKAVRFVRGGLRRDGYWCVGLWKNNKGKSFAVHRLVALAFIPPVPGKLFTNHKDGNKLRNLDSNLEWVTKSENTRHAFDVLGHKAASGEAHGQVKLTTDKVCRIRKLYDSGVQTCDLARMFGVKHNTIRAIVLNHTWINLPPATRQPDPRPQQGHLNGSAILNDEKVTKIRQLKRDGMSCIEIAQLYGVSKITIQDAVARRTWIHIP